MKSSSILFFFKKIVRILPWSIQDRMVYFYYFRRIPNIRRPVFFNEKILFRKIHQPYVESFSVFSDKYRVRKYVSETIGDEYLIPLYLMTHDAQDFNKFKFESNVIIKPNHCAGIYAVLTRDASEAYRRDIVKDSSIWMKINFSKVQREKHYSNIPPCLLVEKLLGDGITAPIDYKFHIFNSSDGGFNYVLQLISNRFSGEICRAFYVNSLTELFRKDDEFLSEKVPLELLSKALEMSRKLSIHFDYVRVDWYIHDKELYFGELTFTPAAGFGTGFGDILDKVMGDFWSIMPLDQLNNFPGLERYR